jgi:hypothetical protein
MRLLEKQGTTAPCRCRLNAAAAPGQSARSPGSPVYAARPYAKATRNVPGGIGGVLAHPRQPKTAKNIGDPCRKIKGDLSAFVNPLARNPFTSR